MGGYETWFICRVCQGFYAIGQKQSEANTEQCRKKAGTIGRKNKYMSQGGLEPPTNALKERYSTIELLAHVKEVGKIYAGDFFYKAFSV